MPLTPIFHPQEDWYQAMVTKNKGSLKATNRQEEWYEDIVDSMASGGLPDTTSASFGDVLTLNNSKEAVWTTPSSGGGVLVVTDTDGTLDKTWQEIHDAGAAIISLSNNAQSKLWYIVTNVTSGIRFSVSACLTRVNGKTGDPENDFRRYAVDSADGYPVLQ